MHGHATINRLYRLVWSDTLGTWVAVAETTRGRGKRSGRGKLLAALFAGLATGGLAQAAAPPPNQLPTGGQVTGGQVGIGQQGATMTVTQGSQRGAIDWQTFNVGSQAQVNFVQPSSSAVTLNRVLDTQASQIYGRISANGQVFLSNPNGVYFSAGASVDVGGLVATTHGIDSADFMAGGTTFKRDGATGSVVNDGRLNAALGGYIALLAPEVRNNGIVVAQAGTVALAGGEAISLQFDARQSLVGVLATPAQIDVLVENGNAVRAPGGTIIMSAQAARQLQDGVVRNSGTLEASGLSTRGGRIVLDSAGLVENSGSVAASNGGRIETGAERMLNSGSLRADGGGAIASSLGALVETAAATVSATGGAIAVDTGAGQLYTSASYDAGGLAGQRGGSVTLSGANVALMGAQVNASGDAGGGSIRIGGDFHGANAAVRNAATTTIGNGVILRADALKQGDGGKVVVWSDDTTRFAGSVSARGGADGGDGGQLEVSGKQDLYFTGGGDAGAPRGKAGSLLLDPKNIYIDAELSGQKEFIDPHPTTAGTFGTNVVPLSTKSGGTATSTGYVVVTNPTDNYGATNGGATYLFRAGDQALISTLYGSHVDDRVGNGAVTALDNGNFVVLSRNWDSGKGAATWGNGTTGWGATPTAVSSANSLVGTTSTFTNSQGGNTSDGNGLNVRLLNNGNYLVTTGTWNNNRGAVTFGNAATGVSGAISASNSLVGSTPLTAVANEYASYKYGDQIGNGVQLLANGNYVVVASGWNMGVGAIALGSGTTGLTGTVSAATALVGDSSRFDSSGNGNNTDKLGYNFTMLGDSRFVTYQSNWNNGAGVVTSFDGVTPVTGVVSAGNSLLGAAGDRLGSGGVTVLSNQDAYVVSSPTWNGSRGAVTYVPFTTNVKNISVATSGVTGSTSGDAVGSRVTMLANQDYVVSSPSWNGTRGASTLVDGSTGKTKAGQAVVVSAANSLVGSQSGDQVGYYGILELTGNGNYLALSPYWANGGATKAGAVTWSSGSRPTVGAVSAGNSLVGSAAGDRIGSYQYYTYQYNSTATILQEGISVTALANGNYAVASPMFNGTRGAATWVNGASGATANGQNTIGAANSLLGSSAGDFVGGYMAGYDPVTNPTTQATSHYDAISNGITALGNGNFVVTSPYWKNGAASKAGAVTWSNGAATPTVGAVSAANSLVGVASNDMVGMGRYQSNGISLLQSGYDSTGKITYSGNYVVTSAYWDSSALADAGAITWGSGDGGLTGTIDNANSLVGTRAGEINSTTVAPLANNGNYLLVNSAWTNGSVANAGAVTWVDGSTGRLSNYADNGNTNVVSAANSLVGTRTNDRVGAAMTYLTSYDSTSGVNESTGNYVVRSTQWNNGSLSTAGAVTWGDGRTGVRGTIDAGNSILGQKPGDALGGTFLALSNGNYVIANRTADIDGVTNAGAVALVDGTTGQLSDYGARGNQNILSAANSMVGSHTDDKVGTSLLASANYGPRDFAHPGFFILSTLWNCQAGALTYIADASQAPSGVIGTSNSTVGNPNDNLFGGTSTVKGLDTGKTAYVTFTGTGGHVVMAGATMPAAPSILMPDADGFADAATATQAMTPDYVAGIMRTGTSLTLQANNDIYIKSSIDASGGTAGGGLTLQAGRSVTVMGNIVTGNRDLTIVANESAANGVQSANRDDGIATISMGKRPQGTAGTIDAGTGKVSITMAAGTDKTYSQGGSISLNSISADTIAVANNGNGQGTSANLPSLAVNCCGYDLGYRGAGADVVLNSGAVLRATGTGTAVTLAAAGKFTNNAGNGSGTIVMDDPAARWLVYAAAPGTAAGFGNLDSGNTAIWNTANGAPVAQAGNRYVFKYQPTVTVNTQDVTKTYGDDLESGNALASRMLTLAGAQPGMAGAYLADTVATAISGNVVVSSAGAAAGAAASATPYAIAVDLTGVTGNNGYAVALGNNTPRTLMVGKKALGASLGPIAKTYDGTTGAVLSAGDYSLSGLVNGDTFNVIKASGSFGRAGAGTTGVSTALAASDFVGVNGALASNYILPVGATGSGTIAPKVLTASVSATKTYDGSASATLASGSYTLDGFVAGQSATVNHASGSFNSANAADATTVTASLAAGDFRAAIGTDLANYVLPATASGAGTIVPKTLALGLGGTLGKQYDGSNGAALSSANYNLTGFVPGESATITKAAGTYDGAGAGSRRVSVSLGAGDYQAGAGTTLSNYVLPVSASQDTSITRAALTVTANDAVKTYDGQAFYGNGVSFAGLVGSETAAVLGGTLTYGGTAQGATNAGSYGIRAGGYTSSNYVINYVDGRLVVNAKPLTATMANLGKIYDGNAIATLTRDNFSLSGFVGGQGASVTQTVGTYDSRNAGIRTVTASLSDADFRPDLGTQLSNYILPTSAAGSAVITPRSVILRAPAVSKTYDGGTAYATGAGDLAAIGANLVGGDTVGSAAIAFADRNAGTGNRGVLLNGATINDGNNGANYTVTLAGNDAGTIVPRVLTVTATGRDRVYDAGTGATVSLSDDRVDGDQLDVSYASARFADKNAGTGKAISVAGIGKTGGDSGNYVLASDTAAAKADIARAQLVLGGVAAVGRTYDTGTAVTLAGRPTVNALGNDVVAIGGRGVGTLADKNAGQGKQVTVSGYTIGDTNYTLVQPTGLTVDIAPAVLALGGLSVDAGKTYDGSSTAILHGTPVVTGLNGETVGMSGIAAGQFADANAGRNKAVTVSGLASTDSNYVIGQQPGLAGNIAPAALTVGLTGVGKVYDGNATATLSGANFTVAGLIGSDSIALGSTIGLYDSRNAGARTVSVVLGGGDYLAGRGTLLSNYLLPASASTASLITPKSVTLGAPAVTKVYDGGTAYGVGAADRIAMGTALLNGDVVAAASMQFADKNVGTGNRTVSITSATIEDGNGGANYSVTYAANHGATITPRTLAVTATGVNRIYDAGTGATVTLADDRVAGDDLAVSNAGARFADKNAGTGKRVVVDGLDLGGADSGNYRLAATRIETSADIAQAELALGGVTAVGRVYDTGTAVAMAGTPTVKALGNDVVVVGGRGVGTLADKSAGQGKQVTVSGYTIGDTNYTLVQPTGLTVDIAPAVLDLNGLAPVAPRTYDGTRIIALSGTPVVTGLNGETVTVGGTGVGQFADKNVGSGKAITVSGLVSNDGNYVIGQQAGLTGSIIPASLDVTGLIADDKRFDGRVDATLSGTARIAPLAGDAVTLAGTPSASFASAASGIGKAVTVSGYTLDGADAGNYMLVQPGGLVANIDNDASLVPAPVAVAATAMPTPPLTVQLADTAALPSAALVLPAAAAAAPQPGSGGIMVSLVRETGRQQGGLVTVSVPKEVAQGAAGFSFALPAQLVEAAAVSREQVTASTTSGGALPSWLSYDNGSKTFTATAAPEGSLPIQVMLTIGLQQAVIVIGQSAE